MLDVYSVYLFIAEPPSNATGPRKFVFDEFSCAQWSHVDTMLRGVDEQSTICEEFRHREGRGDSHAFRQLQDILRRTQSFMQFRLWKSLIPREPWLTVHRGPEVSKIASLTRLAQV